MQKDHEFQTSMSYRLSSMEAQATQQDPASKNKQNPTYVSYVCIQIRMSVEQRYVTEDGNDSQQLLRNYYKQSSTHIVVTYNFLITSLISNVSRIKITDLSDL